MIEGFVSESGVPFIELEIAERVWTAIIDTGFNGDLELPLLLRPNSNAELVGRMKSNLAADQWIEEDVFLVDFDFDGLNMRAHATFVSGNEILIGTGLLYSHRLEISFPAGTTVNPTGLNGEIHAFSRSFVQRLPVVQ
jgi:predicted aspartyl protease